MSRWRASHSPANTAGEQLRIRSRRHPPEHRDRRNALGYAIVRWSGYCPAHQEAASAG